MFWTYRMVVVKFNNLGIMALIDHVIIIGGGGVVTNSDILLIVVIFFKVNLTWMIVCCINFVRDHQLIKIFWETKMGAFMVILHSRKRCRLEVDSRGQSQHQQHQRPCGRSTSLRMPTNGLLRTTGLEPRYFARSVRILPTQPNPR